MLFFFFFFFGGGRGLVVFWLFFWLFFGGSFGFFVLSFCFLDFVFWFGLVLSLLLSALFWFQNISQDSEGILK